MRIDRDAAAVVADRYPVAGGELDLDARGMAGNGLVHRVVEHLGDKVMQPTLVGTANKHARAATNRLQSLEDLDILGGIAVRGSRARHVEEVGHGANIRIVSVNASSMRYQPGRRPTKYWKHRAAFRAHRPIHRGKSVVAQGTCWDAPGFAVMMAPTMMTNERKIWEAALLLVRRHGAAAAQIAQQEVQRLRSGDDELTCVVWCWIARSTAELLRPVPDKGERVH
jgi:hypothetical protein